MEEYKDVKGNALVMYDATNPNDATIATIGGQKQGVVDAGLQPTCQLGLEIERNQLGNLGVLKTTSGNAAKWNGKAETRLGIKVRSTNLATLKMIARQRADEKLQLEEQKTDLLHNLTKKIAQIHKANNIVIEAQHEEMERQREQFQFEIYVLGKRI